MFQNTAGPTGKAIQELGYNPVFLYSPMYQGDTKKQINSFTHYTLPKNDPKTIEKVLRLKGLKKLGGMISTLNEKSLENSYFVGHKLGGKTIDQAVILINNKANLCGLIPEYCLHSIVFKANKLPFDDLRSLLKKYGKLIVKPAMGFSSQGIRIINSVEDLLLLEDSFTTDLTMKNDEELLAEPFIDGALLSLDGFVHNGEITFLGFAAGGTIGKTETIFEFPVDDKIPKLHRKRAYQAIEAIVKKANYNNGYFLHNLLQLQPLFM